MCAISYPFFFFPVRSTRTIGMLLWCCSLMLLKHTRLSSITNLFLRWHTIKSFLTKPHTPPHLSLPDTIVVLCTSEVQLDFHFPEINSSFLFLSCVFPVSFLFFPVCTIVLHLSCRATLPFNKHVLVCVLSNFSYVCTCESTCV